MIVHLYTCGSLSLQQQQLQQACKEGNVAKVQELVRIPEIKVDFPDQVGASR